MSDDDSLTVGEGRRATSVARSTERQMSLLYWRIRLSSLNVGGQSVFAPAWEDQDSWEPR